MAAVTIYAVECMNAYYIGRAPTDRIEESINNLIEGMTEWARNHPPVRILFEYSETLPTDYHMTTMAFMNKYGVDKVRSDDNGCLNHSHTVRNIFAREIPRKKYCLRCGTNGHLWNRCGINTIAPTVPITKESAPSISSAPYTCMIIYIQN